MHEEGGGVGHTAHAGARVSRDFDRIGVQSKDLMVMAQNNINERGTKPAPHEEQQASMELEHAVGYSSLSNGLFYHPNGKHLVYAAGGTVVLCDYNDPHAQHILTGHDGMITCLALGNSGR